MHYSSAFELLSCAGERKKQTNKINHLVPLAITPAANLRHVRSFYIKARGQGCNKPHTGASFPFQIIKYCQCYVRKQQITKISSVF